MLEMQSTTSAAETAQAEELDSDEISNDDATLPPPRIHCFDRLRRILFEYQSRPRVLFASTFIWLSVLGGRFLAPFLEREAGLTPSEIGVCLSAQQLVLTLFSGFAGYRADTLERYDQHLQSRSNRKTKFRGHVKVIRQGTAMASLAFCLHGLARIFPGFSFLKSIYWHLLLQLCQGLGVCMIFPVLDGMTIEFLERAGSGEPHHEGETSKNYGRERLHGPMWWAVINLSLSPLLDWYGFQVCYPLALVGAASVALSSCMFLKSNTTHSVPDVDGTLQEQLESGDESATAVTSVINDNNHQHAVARSSSESDEGGRETEDEHFGLSAELIQTEDEYSQWMLLKQLVTATSGGIAFLICLFCVSSGQAMVDNLVFLFFEKLGSKWLLMGITVVIKISFEVPIFYWGPYLLKTYGAPVVLLLGCLCYLSRVVAYPFVPKGNMLFPILLEPLHGITYGAVQVAMVEFVAQAMPAGREATGQGMVYLFKDGGSVLGVLAGGVADGRSGSKLMFAISAIVVGTGSAILILSILAQRYYRAYAPLRSME